jgi:hypothetical protein
MSSLNSKDQKKSVASPKTDKSSGTTATEYLVRPTGPLQLPKDMKILDADMTKMDEWTQKVDQTQDTSNIIHTYVHHWTTLIMSGKPVPAPCEDSAKIAAEGFRILCEGLKNAGVKNLGDVSK